MSDPQPVRFQPVEETAESGSSPDAGEPSSPEPAREAERERFPLAGPILAEAREDVLRGRCSSCESRLRVQVDADRDSPLRVRCPICGHTRWIEL